MIKRRTKKLLSAFLCAILLVSQLYCEYVLASNNDATTYEQVNRKIVDAYAQGEDPVEILTGLTEEEAKVLSCYYADYPTVSVFSEEILESDEIKYVDNLAAEYYNALEKSGQLEALADMSVEEANKVFDSTDITQPLSTSRAAQYYEPADYSAIIKTLGYTFSFDQIARQLVLIGSSINLGAAFPFIELTAIVAGAFIVTFSIAVLYCAAMVATNELICGWYLYSTAEVEASTRETARVVADYQSGKRYWLAHLANWGDWVVFRYQLL